MTRKAGGKTKVSSFEYVNLSVKLEAGDREDKGGDCLWYISPEFINLHSLIENCLTTFIDSFNIIAITNLYLTKLNQISKLELWNF